MTLRECTKEELIKLIETVSRDKSVKWKIERALSEIEYHKEMEALDAADLANKEATEKRREYNAILAPYAGKSLRDIPPDVVQRAAAAGRAADAAEARWYKLMGIKRK